MCEARVFVLQKNYFKGSQEQMLKFSNQIPWLVASVLKTLLEFHILKLNTNLHQVKILFLFQCNIMTFTIF